MTHSTSVLLVDDDMAFTETLKDVLDAIGYDVETAEDGPQALRKAHDRAFNLILLDLKLPGMTGVEVFRQLRHMGNTSRVVMMTAYSPSELAEECLRKGNLVRLPSPPELSTLKQIVTSMEGRPALVIALQEGAISPGLMESLAMEGFRVAWAEDLEEAFDHMVLGNHDITFVYVPMEGLADQDALMLFKELDGTVMIMLSIAASRGLNGHPTGAGSASVLACFQKPFHLGELIELLHSVEPHSPSA